MNFPQTDGNSNQADGGFYQAGRGFYQTDDGEARPSDFLYVSCQDNALFINNLAAEPRGFDSVTLFETPQAVRIQQLFSRILNVCLQLKRFFALRSSLTYRDAPVFPAKPV